MIPELGHFSLILALVIAATLGIVPIAGAARNDMTLMALARPLARAQCVCVLLAFACLAASFINNDFSVLNVATNSNSELPLRYRFAATWGSHEGSLLLWVTILSLWTLAVSVFSEQLPPEMLARVLGVLGLISAGFLLFTLWTSNPFERLLPAAAEGRDLNPLLQDPGMVSHPPVLYTGYVGFSVAFAFALAALIGGRLDAAWARWSRPWTTLAWCFLTAGIALGSMWAYYVLGWGGWWFWDSVENASFMPWLAGTALLHSLAVTEKRGAFKSWTVLLAIIAFSLSLIGTFLVRSGVLTSVHAFANDPARGSYILAFLVVVIGGSLALYARRAGSVGMGNSFGWISRESSLLANNVLLVVAMASVLLGTLYPLLADVLHVPKPSVGPPYFNLVFPILMGPAIFLMGVGPITRWKQASPIALATRLKWALAVTLIGALLLPLAMGSWSPIVACGLALALWIFSTSFALVRRRIASSPEKRLTDKLRSQSLSWYGMVLAHLGIGVFIVGVTLVKGYETERDVRMGPGDTAEVAGYEFKFDGTTELPGPNYTAIRGIMEVTRQGRAVATLYPEKRTYNASGEVMTEAAIEPGFARDLYVSLGDPLGGSAGGQSNSGAWAVRLYYKPFVHWIWGGCFTMALGGLLAISDRRYRQRRYVRTFAPKTAPAPATAMAENV